MNIYNCKECGEKLELEESQLKIRKYTLRRNTKLGVKGEVITKRYMRKLYKCNNPDCKEFKHCCVEPDCEHKTKDIGQYMFEHCYICLKCGYMVCYDSSG
jgi:hypothetical protein